jgi:hypothetical protein
MQSSGPNNDVQMNLGLSYIYGNIIVIATARMRIATLQDGIFSFLHNLFIHFELGFETIKRERQFCFQFATEKFTLSWVLRKSKQFWLGFAT